MRPETERSIWTVHLRELDWTDFSNGRVPDPPLYGGGTGTQPEPFNRLPDDG